MLTFAPIECCPVVFTTASSRASLLLMMIIRILRDLRLKHVFHTLMFYLGYTFLIESHGICLTYQGIGTALNNRSYV